MQRDDSVVSITPWIGWYTNNLIFIFQRSIYVGSHSGVVQVPMSTCQRYLSCYDCVFARDPFCGWDGKVCVEISSRAQRWGSAHTCTLTNAHIDSNAHLQQAHWQTANTYHGGGLDVWQQNKPDSCWERCICIAFAKISSLCFPRPPTQFVQ